MNFRRAVIFTIFVLLSRHLYADVTIDRHNVQIERRNFDPKNPPADMPKLHLAEAALTQSYFSADSRVGGDVIEHNQTADGCQASIKVDTVHMTLQLRITIWLPDGANQKLIDHEEGHRKIAEHYYLDAEKIAREQAQNLIGQTITGSGKDCDEAGDNALKRTAVELGQRYLGQTDVPGGKAQDFYDDITSHGTNAVKEDRAMQEAIEKVTQDK